jgi:catechol 2,3-dioxygenase-like lactoylglutathione lyase family enzyme
MKASLTNIAPVFRVSDLPRSIRFYVEQLGFEVEFSYEDFYASVRRDGCHIHLKCAPSTSRDQTAFEHAEHLDACVTVSSAENLAAEFSSAGANLSVPLRTMPYGIELYVRDPDGYIIGFLQPVG